MNRLSNEKSSYLKHAASQKIDWYPWCEEAFERARQEDKPLFLSTGAVWCHWCHVMAKESFQDEETAKLLNENFINIKLDRDERPDIDRLYQRAVAVIGISGGWPLNVFLTPDKKPFFGGTYFPPDDRYGRPGFKNVLKAVIGFYHSKREEIHSYTEKIISSLKQEPQIQGEINEELIDNAVEGILSEFDPQNGGFGTAPKFPVSGALEFLINRYVLSQKEPAGYAVRKTLESMAKGGFYDQIGGGFHRYSTDEEWIIPHFEKMADDNAWLLRNYIEAYSVFKDKNFREIAEGIIRFIRDVLSCPDGGFYASQDADVSPDDEGGYFTWTDADFRKALNEEEYPVMSLHFFHEKGAMHHDRSKRVLFIAMSDIDIARQTGKEVRDVNEIINSGKEKLLIARYKRKSPFIDKTLYTSLNGMLITAYLIAFRALGDAMLKDFALKSLDKIISLYFTNNELFHSEGVKGLLEDYVHLIEALLSAYEVTGGRLYLGKADALMELCIERFYDGAEGGFFESSADVLGLRLKGVEDISNPSPNSLAVMLLLRLHHLTLKRKYYQCAESALKAFSQKAKNQGVLSGYYFASLDAYFNIFQLAIHTTDSRMINIALSFLSPYVSISYGEDKGYVIPCFRGVCYEPLKDPVSLREFLNEKKYLKKIK